MNGKVTHIELTYFKESGKYYSQGELDLPYEIRDHEPEKGLQPVMFHVAVQVVEQMLRDGKRPGLIDGYDFHTLVTVFTEFGPLSCLFVRRADRTLTVQP